MLVLGRLHPVARGPESSGKDGKAKKRPCVFVISHSGIRDNDGLFTEHSVIDCWIVSSVANTLKAGQIVEALLNVNGDFISVQEMTIGGKKFVLNEKREAEEVPFN